MNARSTARVVAWLALAGAATGPFADVAHAYSAPSDQDLVRVNGRVTAISGVDVYIDVGRDELVRVGDTALFFPPGVSSVEGTVRAVARHSARVELAPGSAPVETGVRVEVLVPRERTTPKPQPTPPAPQAPPAGGEKPTEPAPSAQPAPAPAKPPPVHPPWSAPPESWSSDKPLLAPAFGIAPKERPREIDGRAWIDLRDTHDDVGGSKEYFFGRVGGALRVTNPFGAGGALEVESEVLQRNDSISDSTGSSSDSDTQLYVRRLAYVVGDTREDPTRLSIGRFYASEFPELGTVDGVEWVRRTSGGSRYGAHVGGLPRPFPGAALFEDYGASVFGRYAVDESERLTFGGAFQTTWHAGDPDRDLLLLQSSWRPSKAFAWNTSAWLDWYTQDDVNKSSGFELTEISTQVRWTFRPDWGTSARLSHRVYPELLREDFAGVSPELLQDGELDRGSLSLWHALTDRVRIEGRVDAWQDQDDDGQSYELGTTLRDVLYERGAFNASVFHVDGTFSSGLGARASASRSWERTFATLGYEYASFDQKGVVGEQANLAHHAVFGSLDLPLGDRWSVTLSGDSRFGDEQDSWSVGLMLQVRY